MGFTAPRGQDRLFSTQIGRTSRSPRAAQAPAEVQSRAEDGLPIPEIPHSIGLCTPIDSLMHLGSGELSKKFVVKANAFSASAKDKIEKKGGRAEVVEG